VVVEVREIGDAELPRWVRAVAAAGGVPRTTQDYLDWRRQAVDTAWFLAPSVDGDVGTAVALTGWHVPPGVGRMELNVRSDARRRGIGGELLAAAGSWLRAHGATEALVPVAEGDPDSLAWAERRGFREVAREGLLVLDLTAITAPAVAPPEGIEVVTWADRPELARGMYAVASEAYPDIPGEEDDEIGSFEEWLARDLHGSDGDRPDATFVAVAGDTVVGYAKFSISSARPGVAHHDLTGVLRAWRGRGIAGALKRAEIRWAKENGFTRLETTPDYRNEPSRRLNERHGYRAEPGTITLRGPV
jgi:GNAT superfamily N-acetyltransferase